MKGLQSFGRATTSISTTIAYFMGGLMIIGGIIALIIGLTMKVDEKYVPTSMHFDHVGDEAPPQPGELGGECTFMEDDTCNGDLVCMVGGKCGKKEGPGPGGDGIGSNSVLKYWLIGVGIALILIGILTIVISKTWNKSVQSNDALAGVAGAGAGITFAKSIFD